jgi:endonuclease YncB( thermonuclease family)
MVIALSHRLALLGLACAMGVAFAPTPTLAQTPPKLFGTPMIIDAGRMMLDGHTVELWGINMLAGDQPCWQGDRTWSCGEESLTAYKHFVDGQLVSCDIKDATTEGLTIAQCWLQDGQQDIARHLIVKGWAFAKREISGNYYGLDEDTARKNRLGIWTSRFQTAEDWRNSVPNFVDYEMAAEPVKTPPPVIQQTIINNYNYGQVLRSWPDGRRIILLPDGRTVRIWKRQDGSEAWTVLTEQQQPVVPHASSGLFKPEFTKPVFGDPQPISPPQAPVAIQPPAPSPTVSSSNTASPVSATLDATATDLGASTKLLIK